MTHCLRASYLLVALSLACGELQGDNDHPGYPSPDGGTGGQPECFSSSECPLGWTCSDFGTCQPPTSPGDPPAEVEHEYGGPASSLRYVYVAMTELNALARIDGVTMAVTSLRVGERPELVVTAPDTDTAVVLDSINSTATVVRPTVSADDKQTFRTLPHLNRVVADPSGRHAVAWFDLAKAIRDAGGTVPADRIGSFQDVTILSLMPDQLGTVDLTVGFRPREVQFDDAGTRAYVITEDGVSVIDLVEATQGGPSIVAPIPVTGSPLDDPASLEVEVTATGEYAVAREPGQAHLRVVRMLGEDAGASWTVPLPGVPTDVDLSPDGQRAYVVIREVEELSGEGSALAVIDLPGDALEPDGVDIVALGDVSVGSLVLSRGGERGLLFTNASLREELTVVALDQPGYPIITYPLQKSVLSVAFDPTGQRAIVFHAKAPGDPADAPTFEEFIDRSHGYSIFDLGSGFAKLQITPVRPERVAFAPDAPLAYVILDGGDDEGAVARAQILDLATGVVRSIELGTPPEAVGVLPDARVAYISQRHPLGRMTFIDIDTSRIRTITGFDLNSRIID